MARAGGVSLRRGFALRCRRARRSVAGNRRLRRPYVSKERKTPAVLGLDMGGTHTDAVLLRGGTLLASVKVPTNHQDLLVSTREALHALFESGAAFPADVSRATFGTTLAVNAVVQDACAPVGRPRALLYVEGFA